MDKRALGQFRMLAADLCSLWIEAGSVVWLRTAKIARGGPEAMAEAELMISEKIAAQQDLLAKLAAGKLGQNPLAVTAGVTRYVLEGVQANRRRLAPGHKPSPARRGGRTGRK
jgi:hypothetical protein